MKWISAIKNLVVEKVKAVAAKADAALHAAKNSVAKIAIAAAVGLSMGLQTMQAHAATTVDLTAITGAVSATDIVTGVLAIGAVLAVVHVTVKAAKLVMGFLKSA